MWAAVLCSHYVDCIVSNRNIIDKNEFVKNLKGNRCRLIETISRNRGYYVTSQNVASSIPEEAIGFFDWPNPSSRNIYLGTTQPLTEMSTRNLPGGKGRPACKADNLSAICEPISSKYSILDISQPYGPPRSVIGIALHFLPATKHLRRADALAEIWNLPETSPERHFTSTCMMSFKVNKRNFTADSKQYSLFSISERLFYHSSDGRIRIIFL
jgi:hypothetical protein